MLTRRQTCDDADWLIADPHPACIAMSGSRAVQVIYVAVTVVRYFAKCSLEKRYNTVVDISQWLTIKPIN
ncbi:hypothetical protein DPMN_109583 [Dreissena polymorpha]|uniref:Uncharacterized protein n=1 Tax=Dreissena polymorpha TaxID=45954 RepID=A0A9D4KAK1_DREPO|nr:hypothetical protein DPMN_109583 [Dreissena polymorpha]